VWKRLSGGVGEFLSELVGEALVGSLACGAFLGLIYVTHRHPVVVATIGVAVTGLGVYGGFYVKRTWRQTHLWRASSILQRVGLISFWVLVASLFLGVSYVPYCDCL